MSANHEIPQVILEAVGRNPEWAGLAVTGAPVSGGINNENWRITIGEGSPVFAKIPGVGTELFVNRQMSLAAARQASAAGISPRVLFFDEATGVEFGEFVEDGFRASTTLDFQEDAAFEGVLGVYRTLHGTDMFDVTKTMFDQVEEHLRQVEEEGFELPPWSDEVLANYRDAYDAFMETGLELVPAHNDPMPGNFLLRGDGEVRLIDFEFAANNDASYEVGILLAEMFVDVERSRRLCAVYRGYDDEKFYSRAMLSRMIADTKWGLWGISTHYMRDADFDYYKYGSWKLYRTFQIARHPDYRKWLEAAR
ncbi:choline kinase family protein [Leucobacter ruminantium]|uniref:Phosphotransferase n=1 Tax=Leucobacter ruminantium TaxID=1289170 RepID=A0A939RT81_9MICO|nr:choline kinase family protein [Leucobacter ruminantium]MBO1803795.1 phosphotransferase [Leucobacter ruminantium]